MTRNHLRVTLGCWEPRGTLVKIWTLIGSGNCRSCVITWARHPWPLGGKTAGEAALSLLARGWGWALRLCACASHPSPRVQCPCPSAQLFSGVLPPWVTRLKLPDATSRARLSHSDSVSPSEAPDPSRSTPGLTAEHSGLCCDHHSGFRPAKTTWTKPKEEKPATPGKC